jgi:uncharacterized protein YjdB
MKKFLCGLCIAFAVLLMTSCEQQIPEPVVITVTSVSLNAESVTLIEGEQVFLKATVSPVNAENKIVIWSSSNLSVAHVEDGLVTANEPGEAIITVKTDDGGKTATCAVTVSPRVYPVEAVELDQTSLELIEGDEFRLNATISPDNATNKNLIWISNNTEVASVSDGLVTALKPGRATVTVTTEDGAKTASCEIVINARVYPVTDVSLSEASIELVEGEQRLLIATVSPYNATNKKVFWTCNNTRVAYVDGGLVTAYMAGEAVITVTTEDGCKTATCNLTVVEPPKVSSLVLSENSLTADICRDHSQWYEIRVTPYPADAVAEYEWSSSDEAVATVYGDGSFARVYTEDYGEAMITVTDNRTGLNASMNIRTVVNNFRWNESYDETYSGCPMITLYLEEERNLQCSYTPSYASGIFGDLKQFVFYENDVAVEKPTCISITENGMVRGLEKGIVGIKPTGRVRQESGSGYLYIKVKARYTPVESISLNKTSLSMTQYDKEILQATIYPDDATNQNVIWSSNDASVASVDSKGVVTAVGGGTATITAESEDSSLKATCTVSVTADPYKAVDLGLSVKWAAHNYNASVASEVGGHYLWGDPTGNAGFEYDIVNGEMVPLYYVPNMNSIGGTSYDIVRSHWGGKWRLPTMNEFWELYTRCSWKYTTEDGVKGFRITGTNGNSIFLPMTGYTFPEDGPVGSYGLRDTGNAYYMTSESYKDSWGRFAYAAQIKSSKSCEFPSWRVGWIGMAVRPVR